jgi:hypothetical protein
LSQDKLFLISTVKFNTKYDADKAEGEPSEITTMLFLLDNENPEPYTSVTDFEKSLRWNCEARFVLHINKFWAMKALKNKKRECGFTVKCLQVYITKQSTSGAGVSQVEKFRKRLFAPGTSTPAVVHEQPAKSQSTSSKKVSKKDESSESSDSDDEPEQKQNKPVGKNAKKQTTSESETSEESDDSESEESEEKPKKGNSAKNTKGKKQESSEESESSEQSDSEDEKAKAKAKPAAKPKGKSK